MFQILDHIQELKKYGDVKEYFSWINAVCPVCQGKLKISKNPSKYGSYACYTNNCHSKSNNLIRKLLYKNLPFKESTAFIPPRKYSIRLIEFVDQLDITVPVENFTNSDIQFIPPQQLILEDKTYTYFLYDDFRIVRTDFKDTTKQKTFFPETYIEGNWIQGLPDTFENIPIYRSDYYQSNIVIVEGEKAATIGQLIGMSCITLPTFTWSESILFNYITKLKEHHELKNIIYLRDNDSAGLYKAELVSKIAWKNLVGCNVINLAELFSNKQLSLSIDIPGYDLYDAYRARLVTKSNWVQILSEGTNGSTSK